MLHTNCGELNQLYNTFCRVWAAGGQATLTTSSLDGKLTAKLEIELGQATGARPGAPHQHEVPVSGARLQPPPTGAPRRPRHRGPAAKAKSRARAAAHQAAKAAESAAVPLSQEAQPQSPPPTLASRSPTLFKCDHCDNSFKSENGLKIHKGKTHKEALSPEQMRNTSSQSSLNTSPIKDQSRVEPCPNCEGPFFPGHQCEEGSVDECEEKELVECGYMWKCRLKYHPLIDKPCEC